MAFNDQKKQQQDGDLQEKLVQVNRVAKWLREAVSSALLPLLLLAMVMAESDSAAEKRARCLLRSRRQWKLLVAI